MGTIQKGRSSRKSSTDKKQEDMIQSSANRKSQEATDKVGTSRRSSSTNEKYLPPVKIKLGKTAGSNFAARNSSSSPQVRPSTYSTSNYNNEPKICSIEPFPRKDGKLAKELH